MTTFRRLSTSEQAELALRERIKAGEWTGKLPPVRVLAEQMGLSVPTLLRALKGLRRTGELVKGAGTRPYAIGRRGTAGAKRRQMLLVVAEEAAGELTGADLRLLNLLREGLAKSGTEFRLERLDFDGRTQPLLKWNRILERLRPSHLAVIRGNAATIAWGAKADLPTVLIGGRDRSGGPNMLAMRIGRMLGHVNAELRRLGHRKALMPCPSPMPEVARYLSEKLAEGLGADLPTVLAERWVVPLPSGTAAARGKALTAAVRATGATAIVTVNWEEYLLAQTALAAEGLRVPGDVSMACITHCPDSRHVIPAPAHFQIPENDFATAVIRWMRSGRLDPERLTELALRSWTPGGSLGKARA